LATSEKRDRKVAVCLEQKKPSALKQKQRRFGST